MGAGALKSQKAQSSKISNTKRITPEAASIFDHVIDCYEDDQNEETNIDNMSIDRMSIYASIDTNEIKILIRSALQKMFIFQSLDIKYLDKLVNCFIPKYCNEGDVIIQQGDEGEYMYFIESGSYQVFINEKNVREISFGDIFGELALVFNAKRSATVTCSKCKSSGKLWMLDRKTLRHFQHYIAQKAADDVANILKSVPLLQDLNKQQLSIAKKVATPVEYEKGQIIIRKGDIGNTFYIITEGTVSCSADPFSSSLFNIPKKSISPKMGSCTSATGFENEKEKEEEEGDFRGIPFRKERVRNIDFLASTTMPNSADSSMNNTPSNSNSNENQENYVKLNKGDWFGEIALLAPNSLRTATVVATSEKVKLIAFNRESFETALGSLKDIIDKKSFFRAVPSLVENLPKEKISKAIDMFSVEKFADGDVICKCGDPLSRIMVMRSGAATMWKHPNPNELVDLKIKFENKVKENIEEKDRKRRRQSMKMNTQRCSTASDGSIKEQSNCPSNADFDRKVSDMLNQYDMYTSNSSPSTFSETEYGKKEITWRRNTIKRISLRASMFAASSRRIIMNNSNEDSNNSNDESRDKDDDESKEDEDISQFSGDLGSGDVIGVEAVSNRTPMDYTVIAQGMVSCFVLSEEDWRMLHDSDSKENEKEMQTIEERAEAKLMDAAKKIDWQKLEIGETIGSGTFGVVHLVDDSINNKSYAMKVLDKANVRLRKQEHRVRTEVKLLLSFNNDFICKCYGFTDDSNAYYMLLEMLSGGELKSVVHPTDQEGRVNQYKNAIEGKIAGIPLQAAKFYTAALAIPLMYLHRQGIAYRDLKPENVVLDHNGYPKLIDFGLSKQLVKLGEEPTFTMCGTPEYLAPEVILGVGYNQSVDWWGLGVMLYEMVVGIRPFCDRKSRTNRDPMIVFENIINNRVQHPKGMDPLCQHLISRLLESNPALRMGASHWSFKVFEQHPWFENDVDWYALKLMQVAPPWVPCFGSSFQE